MDRELETAKPFILNGLSLKLVNHEKTNLLNESFINRPRVQYNNYDWDVLRGTSRYDLTNKFRQGVMLNNQGNIVGEVGGGLAGINRKPKFQDSPKHSTQRDAFYNNNKFSNVAQYNSSRDKLLGNYA